MQIGEDARILVPAAAFDRRQLELGVLSVGERSTEERHMNSHSALMLNASNLKSCLTYPYAFVQISEIADRHGIEIIRRDLFGTPQAEWPDYLRGVLGESDPGMILVTPFPGGAAFESGDLQPIRSSMSSRATTTTCRLSDP